jgi:uncharacterized protein
MTRKTGARVLALVEVLAVAVALAAAGPARAETAIPPAPDRWLTDRAGFLSAAAAGEIDARLAEHERRSGRQLLVYIDRTTGGVPIEDWAARAFGAWRVGRKGLDDGLALFVFSADRRLRIEVGYGLEDRVSDLVAARIINERIVPRIRAGDGDGAIRAGVDAMIAASGGEGLGKDVAPARPQLRAWHVVVGAIGLLLFVVLLITHPGLAWLLLLNIASGRNGGAGGGGWGGRGGGGGFSGGGGRSGGGGASGSW